MTKQTNGATAPRTTAKHPFFPCNLNQDPLFDVRSGITLDDALIEASCFLEVVRGILYDLTIELDRPQIWAAAYLVDMSRAIIDAADTSGHLENRHE